jgi:hypothetical protein
MNNFIGVKFKSKNCMRRKTIDVRQLIRDPSNCGAYLCTFLGVCGLLDALFAVDGIPADAALA